MKYLTDIAQWWDEEKARAKTSLENFVDDHPNMFGVVVATAGHTSMELGAGLVDLLRLGDGVSEGTAKGIAQDGLRLIGVLGPLGKGFQLIKSAKGTKLAQLIIDPMPREGICSWVAATKALAHIGHRHGGKIFASVSDLARAVGTKKIGGISLAEMADNFRKIGVSVGPEFPVSNMQQVKNMLRRDGSVVQVSFHVIKKGKATGEGHSMYVFYDHLGKLRIMDRTSIDKNTIYSSLEEVAKIHYGAETFIPRYAVRINNMFAKFIGPKGTATLAVQVNGVALHE